MLFVGGYGIGMLYGEWQQFGLLLNKHFSSNSLVKFMPTIFSNLGNRKSLKHCEKMLFISPKISSRTRHIQCFSLCLFPLLFHYWSLLVKVHSNVHDIIIHLNRNLKIQIVGYRGKQSQSDCETWSNDRILFQKLFYRKNMQKI